MSGAIAFTNSRDYGFVELKRLYPKYYFWGLITAVIIHLLVLIIYFVFGYERNTIRSNVIPVIRVIEWKSFAAPSLLKNISKVGAASSIKKIDDGIPVPSLDNLANRDATIKSNQERRDQNSIVDPLDGSEISRIEGMPSDAAAPNSKLPEINDFVIVEKWPETVIAPIPDYPQVAIKAGITGIVHIKVLIDKEGRVRKAVVVKSDSELLNQAAIDAALKLVFTPAMQNDSPVAIWLVIPYRFNLSDK